MPIINMHSNELAEGHTEYPEGAYCPFSWNSKTERERVEAYWAERGYNREGRRHAVVLYKTHEGLCLREREANYYDDSDFYMLVWDEEAGEPKEIQFGTTRGWCYPCMGSSVDATEEVREKYAAWHNKRQQELTRQRRAERARALLELRSRSASLLGAAGLTPREVLRVRRLRRELGEGKLEGLLKLFGPRVRSKFKISLREQVIAWARGESEYSSPLSRRQLEYV